MQAAGKWFYIVGLLLAIVTAAIGFSADWLMLVIVALSVLSALLIGNTDRLVDYGVRYLTLFAVAAALDVVPLLGPIVTSITGGMLAFFGPGILTLLLMLNYQQLVRLVTGGDAE